jgi:hypothetical protein
MFYTIGYLSACRWHKQPAAMALLLMPAFASDEKDGEILLVWPEKQAMGRVSLAYRNLSTGTDSQRERAAVVHRARFNYRWRHGGRTPSSASCFRGSRHERHGVDFVGAKRFLAELAGIPWERPLTAAEKRSYIERKQVIAGMGPWRESLIRELQREEKRLLVIYHNARRYLMACESDANPLFDAAGCTVAELDRKNCTA